MKLLVTSRQGLGLPEAWSYPLGGMAYPAENGHDVTSDDYDAVQLFAQSARRAQATFSLAAERENVVRICRLVEGMPLPIELAAAWVRILPSAQIVREIQAGLDILSSPLHHVPERHRSMWSIFESSYSLLDDEERRALRQLSVFCGPFGYEAARQVAGTSLAVLAALIEKSLLRVTVPGRYQMHELLRQFGAAKLAADPAEQSATMDRYGGYYLAFLQARRPALRGREQRTALAEIEEDLCHIRKAWNQAADEGRADAIARMVDALYDFYLVRSRFYEGEEAFAYAEQHLQASSGVPLPPETAILLQKIRIRRGAFCSALGQYDMAWPYLEEGLEKGRARGDNGEAALALSVMSEASCWDDDREYRQQLLDESLGLYKQIGDHNGIADVLDRLVSLYLHRDKAPGAVIQLAEECLAVSRELGRPDRIGYALDGVAETCFLLGWYGKANQYYRESLAVFEELGDQLGIALALGGLGSVISKAEGEDRFEAIPYLEHSLAICREIGHRRQIMERLTLMMQVTNSLGLYEETRRYAGEALAVGEELEAQIETAHALSHLGEADCYLGDFVSAREHLLSALQSAFAWPGCRCSWNRRWSPGRLCSHWKTMQKWRRPPARGYRPSSCWLSQSPTRIAGSTCVTGPPRSWSRLATLLPPDTLAAAQERGRT